MNITFANDPWKAALEILVTFVLNDFSLSFPIEHLHYVGGLILWKPDNLTVETYKNILADFQ